MKQNDIMPSEKKPVAEDCIFYYPVVYEVSRIGRPVETERKLLVAYSLGWGLGGHRV